MKVEEGMESVAIVVDEGLFEVIGHFSSPSHAALAGIHNAGSNRQIVNGWTSRKNL